MALIEVIRHANGGGIPPVVLYVGPETLLPLTYERLIIAYVRGAGSCFEVQHVVYGCRQEGTIIAQPFERRHDKIRLRIDDVALREGHSPRLSIGRNGYFEPSELRVGRTRI